MEGPLQRDYRTALKVVLQESHTQGHPKDGRGGWNSQGRRGAKGIFSVNTKVKGIPLKAVHPGLPWPETQECSCKR